MQKVAYSFPHGLLYIEDSRARHTPHPIWRSRIMFTPTSIAIGCLHGQEGDTTVILGSALDVNPMDSPWASGLLETKSGVISLVTTHGDVVMKVNVDEELTPIRIWLNQPEQADEVRIGLGNPADERLMAGPLPPLPRR
jgi:hypothetical protein